MTFSDAIHSRHLPALDGLRAVAVLTVMLYHYTESRWIPGDLGVSLFFVISGFLITLLLHREAAATGTISLKEFYLRRTLRIFPAYYVYIIFSLVVDWIRGHVWSRGLVLAAFTYLIDYYNAFNGHPITSVAHAWSLANEEQFYLLWPLAFIFLRKFRPDMRRRAVVAVIIAVLLWRSYLYLVAHVGAAYVYNAFDTRADILAIGCLLALGATVPKVTEYANLAASRSWFPLITILLLYASRVLMPGNYHYSLGFTVDALLLAVLLVQLVQLSRTYMWAWLDHPLTRFIGAISYPMYLYHGWGMSVATHVGSFGPGVQIILAVLATVIFACASYYLIERPFLALKRRIERGREHVGSPTLLGVTEP